MHANQASSLPKKSQQFIITIENSQRSGTLASKNKTESDKDDRITIKIDKDMWKIITRQIRNHPEWGVKSCSEFIRRAISHELEDKTNVTEHKVLEIQLRPRLSREDNRGRDP